MLRFVPLLTAATLSFVAAPASADVAPSRCDCEMAGKPPIKDVSLVATMLLGAAVAGVGWRRYQR